MRYFPIFFFIISIVLFGGCKSKTVVAKPEKGEPEEGLALKTLLKKVDDNRFEFKYMVVRGNADASQLDESQSFNYKITLAKDSLILVSISKFGIEAVKLLATPDSVFARMSLEKRAIIADYSYLAEKAGLPLTFLTLQDIFTGNPVIKGDSLIYHGLESQLHIVKGNINSAQMCWKLSSPDYRLSEMKGEDKARNLKSSLALSGWQTMGNRTIPMKASMDVEKPYKISVKFEHSKVEILNEAPSFHFNIPNSYEIEYVGKKK